MAKKTVVMVVDNISGDTLPENQGQTVRFGLDGQDYEIDLSAEHAAEFRDAVRTYIHAGRRVSQAPQRRETRGRSAIPASKQSTPRRDTGRSASGRGPMDTRFQTVDASQPGCSRLTQLATEASPAGASRRTAADRAERCPIDPHRWAVLP